MRKALYISALTIACATALHSCDKIKTSTPLTIDWDGMDVTITVPVISDTTAHSDLGSASFTYNLDSLIKNKSNNALSTSNIDSISIKSVSLMILNPDAGNNGQNFKSAHVSFYTDAHPSSVLVANADDNPNSYSDNIPCTVPRQVLKEYFQAGDRPTVHYRLDGQMRTPTTHTLDVKVHASYQLYGRL